MQKPRIRFVAALAAAVPTLLLASAAALLLAAVLAPTSARAQTAATQAADTSTERFSMNYDKIDLGRLLRTVGPRLGERFLFDSTLSGRVTIAVPRTVDRLEAFELLHAALQLKGYAAVPSASGGYRIVSLPETASTARWTLDAPDATGESRIVTLVRLDHIPATALVSALMALFETTTVALPFPPTNSLILGTSERHVAALIELIDELDRPSSKRLQVRRLHYRDASEVSALLMSYYGQDEGAAQGVSVWTDERTNALLYRVGPVRADAVADLIDTLDVPAPAGGEIAVLHLRFADATAMAEQLTSLASATPAVSAAGAPGLSGLSLNVVPDPAVNALLVNADPDTLRSIQMLVEELDQPARQIAVDLQVLELRYGEDLALDFQVIAPWAANSAAGQLLVNVDEGGLPQFAGDAGTTLVRVARSPIILPDQTIVPLQRGALVADAREVNARTLMSPSLVATSGEEHTLFVGNNIPIPREATGESTGPVTVNTTIDRTDTGVEVRIRPTVGEEGYVSLELDLELSDVTESLAGPVEEVGPTLTNRSVQTTAQLLDGESLLIATSSEPILTTTATGTPFLMDLPFIGWMFRGTSEQQEQAQLVVIAQARLLATPEEHIAYSIHRNLAFERASSRAAMLDAPPDAAWSLRVGTESTRSTARATAARVDSELWPAHVVEWQESEGPIYDVYLVGFESFAEAAAEALLLEREGFTTEIVSASDSFGAENVRIR